VRSCPFVAVAGTLEAIDVVTVGMVYSSQGDGMASCGFAGARPHGRKEVIRYPIPRVSFPRPRLGEIAPVDPGDF